MSLCTHNCKENLIIAFLFFVLGFFISPFQKYLDELYFGRSGYTKLAEVVVSVGSNPISLNHLGIEYLNINSVPHDKFNYDLRLEYRIQGGVNIHDNDPLLEKKEYSYNWNNKNYVLEVHEILASGDGAEISVYLNNE